MKVKYIYEFLNSISPFELQEKWDNSGLIIGNMEDSFENLYLSMDLDLELVETLKPNSLVITHHPLIFSGLKRVNYNTYSTKILRELIKKHNGKIKVISKIEKPQALKNIDEIITKSSGIMVARGDLGIEISPQKVPIVQKEIIKKANAQRKVVIVATQMLESMIDQPIPTRAEASDVANAILDGTDAIMLSGETAAGKYPVDAVKMMVSIAKNVESSKLMRHNFYEQDLMNACKDDSIAICTAIVDMVEKINVKAITLVA